MHRHGRKSRQKQLAPTATSTVGPTTPAAARRCNRTLPQQQAQPAAPQQTKSSTDSPETDKMKKSPFKLQDGQERTRGGRRQQAG
eukprot:3670800-Rhodomonas_salina.2